MIDGVYDEVWAVFDHDNHPKRKEAFELAQQETEGKIVNIAFSSIAFEHWVLLHFEKNATAFEKSECRERGNPLNCASREHEKDCLGSKCIGGYLRMNEYRSQNSSTKKESVFEYLLPHFEIALYNVAWLRHQNNSVLPIYERNPYTNMDYLVK